MKINWNDQPLGEITDVSLAKKLGVSDASVGKQRRKRGIPVCGSKYRLGGCRMPGQQAGINWDEQPLYDFSVKELSIKLDVDPSSVRSARRIRDKKREHSHKCPVCFDISICNGRKCKIDKDHVVNNLPFAGYVTCCKCIKELEKQDDCIPVTFSSNTRSLGF